MQRPDVLMQGPDVLIRWLDVLMRGPEALMRGSDALMRGPDVKNFTQLCFYSTCYFTTTRALKKKNISTNYFIKKISQWKIESRGVYDFNSYENP